MHSEWRMFRNPSRTKKVKGVGWVTSARVTEQRVQLLLDVLELAGVRFASDECQGIKLGAWLSFSSGCTRRARSVKWLSQISVVQEESQGFFVQKDYKVF